jgi:hypothetical protein
MLIGISLLTFIGCPTPITSPDRKGDTPTKQVKKPDIAKPENNPTPKPENDTPELNLDINPTPIQEPKNESAPKLEPTPVSAPEPKPEPTPAPEPKPEPKPEPTPAPDPKPEPKPEPTPAPEPKPEPIPESA